MKSNLEKVSVKDGFSYCWFLRTQCKDNVAFVGTFVGTIGEVNYLPYYMHANRLEYHNVICFEL